MVNRDTFGICLLLASAEQDVICIPGRALLIFISILLHLKHYIVSIEHIAEWVHFLRVRGEIGLCLKIITTTQNEHKQAHQHVWFRLFLYPSHKHTQTNENISGALVFSCC